METNNIRFEESWILKIDKYERINMRLKGWQRTEDYILLLHLSFKNLVALSLKEKFWCTLNNLVAFLNILVPSRLKIWWLSHLKKIFGALLFKNLVAFSNALVLSHLKIWWLFHLKKNFGQVQSSSLDKQSLELDIMKY